MGLFNRKDWNVIAIIFQRKDLFQVNGNRGKGAQAEKIRDGAKQHDRTIFWAVFDQKGSFVEGEPGPGSTSIPSETLNRLVRELQRLETVREVLAELEAGKTDKVGKHLQWDGYQG